MKVIDGNGCEATDEVQLIGSSATGNTGNKRDITLYPNPVGDVIIVVNINAPFSYTIYNITGEVVAKGSSSDHQVPTGELPAGLYYLSVIDGQEHWVGRFAKG